jgi:hypothetical protein
MPESDQTWKRIRTSTCTCAHAEFSTGLMAEPIEDERSAGHRRLHELHGCVLETTELLENILSHLSVKDLFKNNRVCKKWIRVIADSPDIKAKILMRPRRQRGTWWMVRWKFDTVSGIDPHSVHSCGLTFEDTKGLDPMEVYDKLPDVRGSPRRTKKDGWMIAPIVMNPALTATTESDFCFEKTGIVRRLFFMRCPMLLLLGDDHARPTAVVRAAPIEDERANVWSTFVSDPICYGTETEIGICICFVNPARSAAFNSCHENHHLVHLTDITHASAESGLTMGDILATAQRNSGLTLRLPSYADTLRCSIKGEVLEAAGERTYSLAGNGMSMGELRIMLKRQFGWEPASICGRTGLLIRLKDRDGDYSNLVRCVAPTPAEGRAAAECREMVLYRKDMTGHSIGDGE